MADEKKPVKPSVKVTPSELSGSNVTEQTTIIFAIMLLGGAVAAAITSYLNALLSGVGGGIFGGVMSYFYEHIWPVWKIVAVVVGAASVYGIVHNLRKLEAINIEERKIFSPGSSDSDLVAQSMVEERKNQKWEKVLKLANSNSESDWRLAILEADIMLEEVLRAGGYIGDSISDMLKLLEETGFPYLNEAWEAHKVRNDIAHGGSQFQLNERETKRVIALFEKVFEEFGVI